MRIGIDFYSLSSYRNSRMSVWNRFKAWFSSLFTHYVHVSYTIGSVRYEYGPYGVRYRNLLDIQDLSSIDVSSPETTVMVQVEDWRVDEFIRMVVDDYVDQEHDGLRWFWLGVGALSGRTEEWKTCSSYGYWLTGGKCRTPDVLFREISGRI